MKQQDHDETNLMKTREGLDSGQLLAWWNKQAITEPDSAGFLKIYNEPRFGLLYRQEAEWLHFRRIVPLHKGMRVLELGCGAGRWTLRIAPLVSKVVGVDFSEEMIKLARERQRGLGLQNVEFCVSAVQNAHWETTFDIVYLSGVTSYLTDIQLRQTLCNIHTMLAPKGILVDRTSVSLGIREVFDDGGYQAIYRIVQEHSSLFGEFGFRLTYRAPSYNRMRFPYCLLTRAWFQRGMEIGLHRLPKASVMIIGGTIWLLEKARPMTRGSATHSHDFFVFNKGSHHA